MVDIKKFRKIPYITRRRCVICDAKLANPVIKLPGFPLTEIYVDKIISEKLGFIDQAFHLCGYCGHGQIVNIIDQDFLYGNHYFTRTSTSPSAIGAIDLFLDFITSVIKSRSIKNIIEIGCNDLYTLKKLKYRADRLYGIDPILTGKENQISDKRIEIIGNFIENVDLGKFNLNNSVVLCSQVLEHIENPKKLIRSIIDKATAQTLFFFQFPALELLIQNGRFDQIFHQHLNYFSLKSVIHMLEHAGAELIDFRINPYHWGTLMVAFKKSNKYSRNPNRKFKRLCAGCLTNRRILSQYKLFQDCIQITNRRMRSLRDETIYGYGAALMLPVLDYYLKRLSEVKYIIDDDKRKDGLYYINLPLRIVSPEKINNIKDSVILITAINSEQAARAIISKLINLKVKQIIVPTNLI